mmetsp:Transcript_8287/g.51621  ORF Transcript_8287/g.51621 Transcript_8287/m.51621 type:complete len:108 (-) Transcript_8287:661-984(-)
MAKYILARKIVVEECRIKLHFIMEILLPGEADLHMQRIAKPVQRITRNENCDAPYLKLALLLRCNRVVVNGANVRNVNVLFGFVKGWRIPQIPILWGARNHMYGHPM